MAKQKRAAAARAAQARKPLALASWAVLWVWCFGLVAGILAPAQAQASMAERVAKAKQSAKAQVGHDGKAEANPHQQDEGKPIATLEAYHPTPPSLAHPGTEPVWLLPPSAIAPLVWAFETEHHFPCIPPAYASVMRARRVMLTCCQPPQAP